MKQEVFLVAGEASADMYGASLLRELKKLQPQIKVWGIGGEALRAEGMEIIAEASELSIVGGSDWFGKIGEVVGVYQLVKRAIARRPPAVAVLMDLPDFNILLARILRALGTEVVYYISPQVWAWRKYRIHKLKRFVDQMFVVLPFEEDFYRKHGIPARFVGHPLAELVHKRLNQRSVPEVLSSPRIAILPGSRRSEIQYHAPIINELINSLRAKYPKAQFRLPIAPTLSPGFVGDQISVSEVELVKGSSHDVLKWADVALVASGTATLETALIGTPFVLFYRVSSSSALLFQYLVRYPGYIGLPNVLLGKEVVKEFFQQTARSELIEEELIKLIEQPEKRAAMMAEFEGLHHLAQKSEGDTPSIQVARFVNDILRKLKLEGSCFAISSSL